MKRCQALCLILGLFLFQGGHLVSAHGLRATVDRGGVVLTAVFSDGRPAADMSVAVYAPGDSERFWSGRTDRNGRFAFFPDREGTWDILIYDRMGHRLELNIVPDTMKQEKAPGPQSEPALKIAGGIMLIGLFFYGLHRARQRRQPRG